MLTSMSPVLGLMQIRTDFLVLTSMRQNSRVVSFWSQDVLVRVVSFWSQDVLVICSEVILRSASVAN